jgi:uncharacterized membrane protein
MLYDILLFLHIVGAAVLLGTGIGIAFFMVVSNHSRDPVLIAHTARTVVLADGLFTATAVIAQPITGWLLALEAGWHLAEDWLVLSIGLYCVVLAFWLPVVWIQLRLRNLARAARDAGGPLPGAYHRLYKIWFACGFPALFALCGIVWLMLTKPIF